MIKKIAKIVLLVLMVVGVFITFSNFMEPELNGAAGKWVQKKENPPDCYGDGNTCFDATSRPIIDE